MFIKNTDGCQHIDLNTGKKCGSKWKLSIDHIYPFSKGGESTEVNYQILCANHNQWKGNRVMNESDSQL